MTTPRDKRKAMEVVLSDDPVVDPETIEAFGLPSTFVNRFLVNVSPTVTRIAFAEALLPIVKPTYHLAFTMLTSDARELITTLTDLIRGMEERAGAEKGPMSSPPDKPL